MHVVGWLISCSLYHQSFLTAFASSSAFGIAITFVNRIATEIRTALVKTSLQQLAELDRNSEAYTQKYRENLLNLYAVTCLAQVVTSRLKKVVLSRLVDIYLVWVLATTIIVTVVLFAFLYLATLKLDATAFDPPQQTIWSLLGYSLSCICTADIMGIKPVSTLAKMLSLSESATAFAVTIALVFALLNTRREQYKRDIDAVINALDDSTNSLEKLFEVEYQVTIEQAELLLMETYAKSVNFFRGARGLGLLDSPPSLEPSTSKDEGPCPDST